VGGLSWADAAAVLKPHRGRSLSEATVNSGHYRALNAQDSNALSTFREVRTRAWLSLIGMVPSSVSGRPTTVLRGRPNFPSRADCC
jgi:hypothetical protein